ncbi:YkvA family protein [Pontibacter oryzae]|uniref:DUF1232 domain-containing protein n=1 Tax=Pontibacter oryzae TaxID=2304593 RepID=A0A399S2Q4_9BACT|nr:YkvA family protein [Pontibacter oryzae]RIJ36719.1 DUF1232 domain-containing protein [Pontibacter oryzae]
MPHLNTLKQKAHAFHTEVYALYLAYRDYRVRWYARVLLAMVIAYVVSPLDLVPDLTPVFGYLDDVAMIVFVLPASYQLISRQVKQESRLQAYEDMSQIDGNSFLALKVISYTWLLILVLITLISYKFLFLDIPY